MTGLTSHGHVYVARRAEIVALGIRSLAWHAVPHTALPAAGADTASRLMAFGELMASQCYRRQPAMVR